MTQDPKGPDSKVGSYDKPERKGATGGIVAIVALLIAVILVLWLFTDII